MSQESPNLTVIGHPLVQHKISKLRAADTSTKQFRELVDELSLLLAYEVTRDLALEDVHVETPLEVARGKRIRGENLVFVPVLRAGLGMVEAGLKLVPNARVGHVGLYRNEDTLEPVEYYCKIPPDAGARSFIVLDPMLATGGSASAAITLLKSRGAGQVRFLCLVAAPQGVSRLLEDHPDVPVIAAALDRELNDRGYIVPGLGDAGDRLFGTL